MASLGVVIIGWDKSRLYVLRDQFKELSDIAGQRWVLSRISDDKIRLEQYDG